MAVGFTNIGNSWGGVRGLSAQPKDVRMGMTYSTDGKTVQTGELNLVNLTPENIKSGVTIAGVTGVLTSVDSLTDASLVSVVDLKSPIGKVGTYTVPDGITSILAVIVGAGGAGGDGGHGQNAYPNTSGNRGKNGEPSWFIDEKYYASGGSGGSGGSGAPSYHTKSSSGYAGKGGNILLKVFSVSPNETLSFYLGCGGGTKTNPIPNPNFPNHSRSHNFFDSLTGPSGGISKRNDNVNQTYVSKGGSGGAGLFSHIPNSGFFGSTGQWATSDCMYGGNGGEGRAGGGAGGGGNLCYTIKTSDHADGYGYGGTGGKGGSGGIRLYLYS